MRIVETDGGSLFPERLKFYNRLNPPAARIVERKDMEAFPHLM